MHCPANNVVTTAQPSGATTTSPINIVFIAGSPTTSLTPVDGTGDKAILLGGGHMAVEPDGNLILSDRSALRRVTPAGVVTTLIPGGRPQPVLGFQFASLISTMKARALNPPIFSVV
jgi:hypothetical protein